MDKGLAAIMVAVTLWAVWRCWTLSVWLIPTLLLIGGALIGGLVALATGGPQ